MLPPSDSEEEEGEEGAEKGGDKPKAKAASSSKGGQSKNAGKLPPSGSEDEDDDDSEEESSEEPLNEYLSSSAPRKKCVCLVCSVFGMVPATPNTPMQAPSGQVLGDPCSSCGSSSMHLLCLHPLLHLFPPIVIAEGVAAACDPSPPRHSQCLPACTELCDQGRGAVTRNNVRAAICVGRRWRRSLTLNRSGRTWSAWR